MVKYEYSETDPASWQPFEPPPKDKTFERELQTIAGKTGDYYNLRLVWAGNLKDDRTEHQNQLKYHVGWTVPKTVGFKYLMDGEEFFTENIEKIPMDILGVVPVIKTQPLGLPRWVIEKYTSPAVLESLKRFTHPRNEDGFKILRDFPREGLYETWLIIDTRDNLYREPAADLLPFICFKWKFEQESPARREVLYEEWQEKQSKDLAKKRKEAWDGSLAGDLKLPVDERARREFMEQTYKESLERERVRATAVTVYQS